MLNFTLLPTIDKNRWNCENCDNEIDLYWIIEEIVKECKDNSDFYNNLLKSSDKFDYRECECCNHTIWFYDKEVKELQTFVKSVLKDN